MNEYEIIIKLIQEANKQIPLNDIHVEIQFSKHEGHHIQKYTYIKIPTIYNPCIPQEVLNKLGNPQIIEHYTKWGWYVQKLKLDPAIAEQLYKQQTQYTTPSCKDCHT